MYYVRYVHEKCARTEKNLFVNFTFFIRKFIIFLVTLGPHSKCGVCTVENSNFYYFRSKF